MKIEISKSYKKIKRRSVEDANGERVTKNFMVIKRRLRIENLGEEKWQS